MEPSQNKAQQSSTSLTVEALYDQVADAYQDAYGDNDALKKALARLTDYLGPGSSALDVGCGPGGPASRLVELGFHVTGIDVSQRMIDHCKSKIPGTFIKADMTKFKPDQQYDAIISIFSMFQISYQDTYSMLFKMASWLRPGGVLVVGCIPAEEKINDISRLEGRDYIERYPSTFMNRDIEITLLTMRGWLSVMQKAGLSIHYVERQSSKIKGFEGRIEEHMFITAQRTTLEPLFGPHPLPMLRVSRHTLSKDAWQPFAKRLSRHDLDVVLDLLGFNKEVLEVSIGHGKLSTAIADKLGKVYTVKLDADWDSKQPDDEIEKEDFEEIPFADNRFDAVVALWALHHVQDLGKCLSEMARVVDPTAPNARIIIVQGAPDNEAINLINKVCGPIAQETMSGSVIDHQGVLLATASRIFNEYGFGNITLERVDVHCKFPAEEISLRCEKAASVLTDLWYKDHPRANDMKEAFQSVLREHFANRPFEIGDQAVILVARPSKQDSN
ncbi:methyltransferase [Fusarium albosuccineum]|uniref:Methyltransferase n=1 Tax=Fusarium albosuccineum TaxID=1237068 RepID=A0A8H4LL37_9HYPO|nr:methyltransferase [Fusarium albosuccineum]